MDRFPSLSIYLSIPYSICPKPLSLPEISFLQSFDTDALVSQFIKVVDDQLLIQYPTKGRGDLMKNWTLIELKEFSRALQPEKLGLSGSILPEVLAHEHIYS